MMVDKGLARLEPHEVSLVDRGFNGCLIYRMPPDWRPPTWWRFPAEVQAELAQAELAQRGPRL